MESDDEWAKAVEVQASLITGLATTSSSKYDAFKRWFAEVAGIEPSVCYLSDALKQWTARVGQALMGLPTCLVLLVEGGPDEAMTARLARLQRYVTGLRTTVVLSGTQGHWSIAFVVGSPGDIVFDRLRGRSIADSGGHESDPSKVGESAPTRQPRRATPSPRFFELEPEEQAFLAWERLLGHGSLPVPEAVRIAARGLRSEGHVEFVRLRPDGLVYTEIESAIAYASRRGILFDRPKRGEVRAFKADADEFTREDWRRCLLATLTPDEWAERDVAVRGAAEFAVERFGLDMVRLRTGGRVDTAVRAAISQLIRSGELQRDGRDLVRRVVGIEEPEEDTATEVGDHSSQTEPVSTGSVPPVTQVQDRPSILELRNMVGYVPAECEGTFCRHLGAPFASTEGLRARVRAHLAAFEAAFAEEEFLDVAGARQLARDAEELLGLWPSLTVAQRALAQAAILYFVESDDADDDFVINGLRTDKAVMAAVYEALR